MTEEEVVEIIQPYANRRVRLLIAGNEGGNGPVVRFQLWADGPSRITVNFVDGRVSDKSVHVATMWETLRGSYQGLRHKLGL